jgi:hypothetical protein
MPLWKYRQFSQVCALEKRKNTGLPPTPPASCGDSGASTPHTSLPPDPSRFIRVVNQAEQLRLPTGGPPLRPHRPRVGGAGDCFARCHLYTIGSSNGPIRPDKKQRSNETTGNRAMKNVIAPVVLAIMFAACGHHDRADEPGQQKPDNETSMKTEHHQKVDSANTPEEVYRRFMLANLTGDEPAIRSLVIEREGIEILWDGGAYPKDVATLLAGQYRTMEIVRVKLPDRNERKETVQLQSSASPVPITMVKVDGVWKVDPSPIIEFRKAARKPK